MSETASAKGSDPRPMRITDAYARTVARHVYFWAWPMVNIYNRRLPLCWRRLFGGGESAARQAQSLTVYTPLSS
jgi:hypothetical protein